MERNSQEFKWQIKTFKLSVIEIYARPNTGEVAWPALLPFHSSCLATLRSANILWLRRKCIQPSWGKRASHCPNGQNRTYTHRTFLAEADGAGEGIGGGNTFNLSDTKSNNLNLWIIHWMNEKCIILYTTHTLLAGCTCIFSSVGVVWY